MVLGMVSALYRAWGIRLSTTGTIALTLYIAGKPSLWCSMLRLYNNAVTGSIVDTGQTAPNKLKPEKVTRYGISNRINQHNGYRWKESSSSYTLNGMMQIISNLP